MPSDASCEDTELVPVPEPSYAREIRQLASLPPVSDAGSLELKLRRLDGFQKRKWAFSDTSSVMPLRKIMIMDFKLTYPSGAATLANDKAHERNLEGHKNPPSNRVVTKGPSTVQIIAPRN
ncbi:hypothetical protein PRUPE_2G066800 [Prunus persica]|uniref:Uncharacterized protein n=1 Tax=Prunus persica TaxID=3760 RepID=M5X5A7_PRUPE|nr:hypothetical protein PRUPE_2G066800 [Prunus persica]